ncbi:MAG: hypothetical protein ABSH51_19455 [Solirubrobacteraceae bacterium]|jgi:DNA-binding IclR family transcriptional regulator
MSNIQELVHSIDERLAVAREEIASLEAALSAVGGRPAVIRRRTPGRPSRATSTTTTTATPVRSSPARAVAAPKAPATRSPKAGRRASRPAKAPAVVATEKLEMLLGASAGLPATALAQQAGGSRDQVLGLLRQLEAAGQVRRSGQRRGTRWHLITDEDRIAARAAELSTRRRTTSPPGRTAAPRARKNINS